MLIYRKIAKLRLKTMLIILSRQNDANTNKYIRPSTNLLEFKEIDNQWEYNILY